MDLQRVKRELELFSGEESKLQITVYVILQVSSRLGQTSVGQMANAVKTKARRQTGTKQV